jgi:phosphopantothenoylcysteine synthetase/decarboxylase
MNIIVTCGPSYEPIDEVRRLTNFSTGRLGIHLSNTLADAGHRVITLIGQQATDCTPLRCAEQIRFTTNDDLAAKLQALAAQPIHAIFHAAALCDYKVAAVRNPSGETISAKKFPTRGHDFLTLTLEPTTKVLPLMRGWFPDARIVSWKYELDGTRDEALEKAWTQIRDAKSNACVVNGAAYGPGFGFCEGGNCEEIPSVEDLCAWIAAWLR